jgi:hypothetical protein
MGVTNGDFTGLTVSNCTYGLYVLAGTAGLNCDGNTFNNNGTGIVILGADVTVTGCDLMANGDGINMGAATGMDVNGNTIKNNNNRGIIVTGKAEGDVYDNNIQLNDVGIRINHDYSGYATSRMLNIFENCLGDNVSNAAYDVNAYGAPTEVVWWSTSQVGNHWGTYYDGSTASYFIPGGTNEDKYPVTATNNPDGPPLVALGEEFTVDFVFSIPTNCDPFQQLKSCHFVIGYDDNLMQITGVEAGDYLPNVEMITNPVQGAYEIDLTALGDGNHATTYSGILATATFVAASDAIGVDQITVSSEYDDKDGNDITVTSTPLDIEVEDAVFPEIRVANLINSPTGDATYSGNPALVNPTLEWTVWDDFDLELFRWRILDDGGSVVPGHDWSGGYVVNPHPDGAGEVSGVTEYHRDLSALTSGTYYMELQLKDAAGHEVLFEFTKSSALAFTIDNDPPTAPTFTVEDSDDCAEPGYTSNLLVDFTITSSHDASTQAGYAVWAYVGDHRDTLPYGTGVLQFTLDNQASHAVYLQLTDVYGNVGGWGGPVNIHYDATAPNATLFNFKVLPASTKSLTPNASVDSWGGSGAYRWAYSVDEDVNGAGVDLTCDDADWQTFPGGAPTGFQVTLPDDDDGDYEVCMVTRDRHGNVSDVDCDVVTLDRTAPCVTTFAVAPESGLPCDNVYGDGFNITISGFTEDPAYVRFRSIGTSTSSWTTWGTYPYTGDPMTVTDYVIPAGVRFGGLSGTYTVEMQVRDAEGNVCATTYSDQITYEHVSGPPTATTLELDGNATAFWTNSNTVEVTVPDASDDVFQIAVCDAATNGGCDPSVDGTWEDFDGSDPASSVTFTLTGSQCDKDYVHVKVRDCGGNENASALVLYVRYDLVAPVISAVEINGGDAKTNSENVTFDVTWNDDCGEIWGYLSQYMVSEDGDFTSSTPINWGAGPLFSHTFTDDSDGDKFLHVKVKDYAGNWSDAEMDDIYLDKTLPTGVLQIVANPTCGAVPDGEYTCDRLNNIARLKDMADDVARAKLRHPNLVVLPPDYGYPGFPGTNVWFAIADPTVNFEMVWPHIDQGPAPGLKGLEVKFEDEAGNRSAWIQDWITYDPTPPTWPGGWTLSASPADGAKDGWGHSIHLQWSAHPDAQYYGLNWQRTTDHPDYVVPFPAYPPTIADEFFGPHDLTGTETVFETVELPGIFFLSLFVQDMAGNWSTNKLTAATTNYYLGDFGETAEELVGGLRIEDFEELKFNYFAPGTHPYDPLYDIGPTHDGSIYGYPTHVGDAVNYEDLFTFTFVFDVHPLSGKGSTLPPIGLKPLPSEGLILSAEMPSEFHTGQEFDAVIRINDPSPVKVMSLTLDYDTELLEPVSIQPGDMFTADNAFLLNCVQGSSILMDGTILGAENVFEGTDVAVIRFRARNSGSFEFTDPKMIFRDRSNADIEVLFSNVASQALPGRFALAQNYPNPFNPSTTIELALPTACDWRCDIYNVAGQIVKSVTGYSEAGMVPILWDGTDAVGDRVASGIYFYRITADSGRFVETKKMVLMK